MCNFACKGCPQNDPYCVGWDVKPYSLTQSDDVTFSFLKLSLSVTLMFLFIVSVTFPAVRPVPNYTA